MLFDSCELSRQSEKTKEKCTGREVKEEGVNDSTWCSTSHVSSFSFISSFLFIFQIFFCFLFVLVVVRLCDTLKTVSISKTVLKNGQQISTRAIGWRAPFLLDYFFCVVLLFLEDVCFFFFFFFFLFTVCYVLSLAVSLVLLCM